ncbi:hypothetical protein PYCCODRAFT_1399756 [Trametes coccinea BRFM310]|uniref:F-box domain-containing protein n=1 Tax=Trametes coccinea (strain BRFM310) TaxID=1353009 RepID=A0A1Y2I6S7_TRAC3|nr:hypothetical protein PYCCODRAFT_1399756 [Trametes coccinea BRFM310]
MLETSAESEGQPCRLPGDLLSMLCSFLEHSDLPSFALVDKLHNEICTPILYRTVRLLYRSAVESCLRTLAADPETLSFGRDLAALVQDFFLSEHWRADGGSGPANIQDTRELLLASLERMTNVRTVRCKEPLTGLGILGPLLATPHPNLKSLDMRMCILETPDLTLTELEERLSDADLPLPQLTAFTVRIDHLPTPEVTSFLHHLIASRADAIDHLGLVTANSNFVGAVIPSLALLPVLQHLEVATSQLVVPGFGHMTTVKSLTVRDLVSHFSHLPNIPDIHWPMLESLACPLRIVPFLLPGHTSARRPISTLRLNFVSYEQDYGDASIDYSPRWTDILAAIRCVGRSAVPLKHLHLQAQPDHLKRFAQMLPYIPKLETLVVALTESPTQSSLMALGKAFIARLPYLHTLLFSDVLRKFYRRNAAFLFARDLDMQRRCLAEYSRHSSALRRVAFTTELEWEKGNDGVWYPSRLPRKGRPDIEENDFWVGSDYSDDSDASERGYHDDDDSEDYEERDEDDPDEIDFAAEAVHWVS